MRLHGRHILFHTRLSDRSADCGCCFAGASGKNSSINELHVAVEQDPWRSHDRYVRGRFVVGLNKGQGAARDCSFIYVVERGLEFDEVSMTHAVHLPPKLEIDADAVSVGQSSTDLTMLLLKLNYSQQIA